MGEWWLAGRYRLIEVLGSGGMAVVWRAHDTHMHRNVAVKLLRDVYGVPGAADRFAREARTAGTLTSPHIVTIHDFGAGLLRLADADNPLVPPPPPAPTSGGVPATEGAGVPDTALLSPAGRQAVYVTMELVPGRSLAKVAAEDGPLPVPRVLGWARQLCDALEVAHDAGVLHRDIKPANIMVSDKGVLKVLDFGIARFMKTLGSSATLTRPGAVLGTAAYMSPEQANGAAVDLRADLYSTGCLMYELLTGLPPFGFGDVPSLLFRHVHVAAESPDRVRDDLPDELCDLILALLAKDPADRPQTAADVRRILDAVPAQPPDRPAKAPARAEELARRMDEVAELSAPQAVEKLRKLLRDHIEVFGHHHPRTLNVRDDLAYYLGRAGERHTAVRMLRQLVSDYGRVRGAEHPDTLGVRRNLAYWTAKAGDATTAAVLLRDLVPDYTQVHGPANPETFKVRRELALCTGRSGDPYEAVRLLRALLPDMIEMLGAEHRRVSAVLEELAYWEHRTRGTA